MKIGLTYDLRSWYLERGYGEEETAEFDRDDTIESLESAIQGLGHATERIGNAMQLVQALARGQRWDLVFNIAEGLRGIGREALVPALLDAYGVPYTFSDPLVMALTLDKAACKRFVRDLGLATPDFAVVREPSDIKAVDLPYPLFAKPVAEGTGKGVSAASKITDRDSLNRVCRELLGQFRQPVLVETFLPGREFTVGIAGTGSEARCLGVMEVVLLPSADPEVYTYKNKEDCEIHVRYRLARDEAALQAGELSLAVYRGLGCRDAGLADIRLDASGRASFMEINPLAGMHPAHSDLPILCGLNGIAFRDLVAMILDSALRRTSGASA